MRIAVGKSGSGFDSRFLGRSRPSAATRSPSSPSHARRSATPLTTTCSASRRSSPPCRTASRPSSWPAKASTSARPRPRRAHRARRGAGHRAFPELASRFRAHRVRQGAGGGGAARRGSRRRARNRGGVPHPGGGSLGLLRTAEGGRGIFVGGGGSVRLPRLIDTARIMDMMLTGHIYDAEEGQAIGISRISRRARRGLAKGIELARRIAGNAPMTNFAVTQVLPPIAGSIPPAATSPRR